jgi:zinc protease
MQHIDTHAFGPSMEVERHRLDNGLEVLVLSDTTAPVISYQTWFAVGSRHERTGKTGIAHLFEHLMFNETSNMPLGAFDKRLEKAGADSNAATFLDWTYYLENLPKEALELVVGIESDRMRNLVLREKQVESEREVVMNERRQTVDDDVDGTVTEMLYMQAFTKHGYATPTIGFMKDIEGLTTADCEQFYATYYAPNNATLVVVGDVEPAALLKLVDEAYGQIPAAEIPVEQARPEPPQTSERRSTTTQPTDSARLLVGYKSPAMGDVDHAPLVLLNEILFGGRSSRANRALVQVQELCTDAGGSVGNFRDPSLWDMYFTARTGQVPAKVLEALDVVLATVVDEPVAPEELERACARIELGTLQGLETVGGKAEQIGFSEVVLRDPCAAFRRLSANRRVDRSDLLRVARRYLRAEARTLIEVFPQ